MQSLLEKLKEDKLVAIMRKVPYSAGKATAEALKEGGITFLEVTLDSENALQLIEDLNNSFGEDVKVGAGTVMNLQMAEDAVAAGAAYLVSPHTDLQVIEYGLSKNVEVWPGALTPTEIVTAYQAGASAVKVFPAGAMGDDYIKNIRGPLAHIPLMGTGGITEQNLKPLFDQGLTAAGLGSNLVNNQLVKENNFSQITQLAEKYTAIARG
ncbi:bifunctional 4-hydroxy-2-oxoglutarate aldolase/2-dehydro-3-deoxy-phosphogluconate aldolase [Alkalicoccus daliensis]|uniref:2-dehydro-3-deoxyphosphogluconate aldolase / (4S)-4-hydroxy-2-oxoglutarate aldolase n=1 Tax=Alkalicoccus daliensis TaxID=745820 RepID=A0A1H0F010_9BACI|nr:bifunctional 4-hydroxy-2-oxoglutarate aldolase/2-dehydro-3-deoxy-phosphogluconate aldolase [Alkalicoccus daliensis]SDN88007.1 2-dehydro-3-deoxyphosphogluconate aldolase / (4S)-4-hydroxy-2-oxoglutarate aldolase [Alkalicoccus daliensis]